MEQDKIKTNPNKKRIAAAAVITAAVLILAVLILLWIGRAPKQDDSLPVLTVETPQKLSAGSRDLFTVDVSLSGLGEALYPAASFNISFDSSCLELMDVREGNLCVTDLKRETGSKKKLPEWNVNIQQCNASGMIRIMYLDLTGGENAFSRELLDSDDNVVFRLDFRLKGSARAGDIYEMNVEDAIFAASDSTQSLALQQETLAVRNGIIVTGE